MASKHTRQKPVEAARQPSRPSLPSRLVRSPWVWLVLVCAVTFVAFQPAANCQWTNWDDTGYVHDNKLIKSLSWSNIRQMFSRDGVVLMNYHPLTILSLAIDYHFVQLEPAGYHIVNIIFHVLNAGLVFLFVWQLSERRTLVAAFVALFFGIHPMHVESVAWVSERKDVLYTFFFFLALIGYLRYLQTQKLWHLGVVLALFYLSILSKAMAVVLPVVLLLIDYYRGRPLLNVRCLVEKLPFFALSVYYGLLAVSLQKQGAIADLEVFTIFQRLCHASYGLWTYCWKLFVPIHLAALHPYPLVNEQGRWVGSFPFACVLGAILVGSVVAYVLWRRDKVVIFGAGFFFVTIALVLQFISVGIAIVAERYSYIPYVGLLFVLGMKADQMVARWRRSLAPLAAATCAAAVVFTFMTRQRTGVWNDPETLWSDTIATYPYPPWQLHVAYLNRGNYRAKERGWLDKGLEDYLTLVKMKTTLFGVYSNMGIVYAMKAQQALQQGDTTLAEELYVKSDEACTKALELNDKDSSTLMNRAITRIALRKYNEAFDDFNRALELDPNNLEIYRNRGVAHSQDAVGQFVLAVQDFDRIIEAQPNNVAVRLLRGTAHARAGNSSQAIADYEFVRQVDPKNGEAAARLSGLFFDQADYPRANEFAQLALSLGFPMDQNYLKTLAESLNAQPNNR